MPSGYGPCGPRRALARVARARTAGARAGERLTLPLTFGRVTRARRSTVAIRETEEGPDWPWRTVLALGNKKG